MLYLLWKHPKYYHIAQNSGGGKLWRIKCHSPIFYPTKFISSFCKTLDFRIKSLHMHWRCELGWENVNLEIFPSPSWSRSKIWSCRLTILILVITSKDTFYRKCVHSWSRDLSHYQSWVSASLKQTTLAS